MSPYRAGDDLLRSLRERRTGEPKAGTAASPDEIAEAEAQLGFHLPPLLRRVYEIANGGFGPGVEGLLRIGVGSTLVDGDDTLVNEYRVRAHAAYVPEPDEPALDLGPWPELLLPICNWGCAIWSCLDCHSDDGAIVTASGAEPFAHTGHSLRSWLSAWLEGVDLFEEMFEPGPVRRGINPFTKEPIIIRRHGKARGARWP